MAVAILRVRGGLDYSRYTEREEDLDGSGENHSAPSLTRVDSDHFINFGE